ncbi:MAG: hypothetical protein Greene07147_157 [Parcubacteria group bacterium Greene0714_7]|nr:MAG: hypothetical protein Greene07147_157 [Parcubacteria group bacterium Greene0714_7]
MNLCRVALGTKNQTNDTIIREALVNRLSKDYPNYRVLPELGIWHGAVRIDVAVVNGVLRGFEIKSDRDTLSRLPEQIHAYNAIFDQVTLIVGTKHFVDAFKMIPEWWGIDTAHIGEDGQVFFNKIRKPKNNPEQDHVSIARMLWRGEALDKLENLGKADGVRSKPRELVYERLAESMELKPLKKHVWKVLQSSRQDWRPDVQPA